MIFQMNARKVVITGCVAVGKSTVVNTVIRRLNEAKLKIKHVPEYIDYCPDGLQMLEKYIRKDITPYEFQTYILNYYETYFNEIDKGASDHDLLLFERTVDDGITCFSNLDNMRKTLTDDEFCKLYSRAKNINIKFNIPSYFVNKGFTFIPIKTSDKIKDAEMIANIILNRDGNIIIGLYNEPSRCYERMKERNRECENYTLEYLQSLCRHYKKLYKVLMSEEELRFSCIGSLW